MPLVPLPGIPETTGLSFFKTTVPTVGKGSTEVPTVGKGSTEVPTVGEGSTEVPTVGEGSTEVPKLGEVPGKSMGGSGSNEQSHVTGEYLMKVFTRMLEILNEKKDEKNNS